MSRILSSTTTTVTGSASPVAFATEGGGNWKVWNRYLTVDGVRVHHLGNICGTCGFFFERLNQKPMSLRPAALVRALSDGLASVDSPEVADIERLLPDGNYLVSLHEVTPLLVTPGDANDYFAQEQIAAFGNDPAGSAAYKPKTDYYRAGTQALPETSDPLEFEFLVRRFPLLLKPDTPIPASLFEFLVPLFPHSCLRDSTVREMVTRLESGLKPTAIAIATLDVKKITDWSADPPLSAEHWCLAHYLLDGHHKTFAAAAVQRPLSLLSFLAIGEGVSSEPQARTVVDLLQKGDRSPLQPGLTLGPVSPLTEGR